MRNYEIFLVCTNGLTSPVKASCYQDLSIYQTIFVVHMSLDIAISSTWYPFKPKSPDISAIKFATFIVCYYPNLDSFFVQM